MNGALTVDQVVAIAKVLNCFPDADRVRTHLRERIGRLEDAKRMALQAAADEDSRHGMISRFIDAGEFTSDEVKVLRSLCQQNSHMQQYLVLIGKADENLAVLRPILADLEEMVAS